MDPETQHRKEWEAFKDEYDKLYEETGNRIYRYRSRCIDGLLTGITRDYSSESL